MKFSTQPLFHVMVNRALLVTLLLQICLVSASAQSQVELQPQSIVAETVWSSNAVADQNGDRQSVIYYRFFDGERWSDTDVLHQSRNEMVTPSIFSVSQREKMLVWSELQRKRTVIMYRHFRDGQWQSERLLSDVGIENLGASLALSRDGQLWAFWSAHQNDNDDIYKSRYDGESWTPAKRVHEPNNVADYAAQGQLQRDGALVVIWKSYSPLLLAYQQASEIIQAAPETPQSFSISDEEDASLSDIIPPNFLPSNALHTVHFPNNRLVRNARVNEN